MQKERENISLPSDEADEGDTFFNVMGAGVALQHGGIMRASFPWLTPPIPHLFDHLCRHMFALQMHETHLLSPLYLSFKPLGCSSGLLKSVRN